jgi:putative thiazole-containing bacteriocin maturation protein
MGKMDPSMRLKVKRDTFYLPEPDQGVYFRNNQCSFRIEGSGMDQWVEKLLPMFNGEYTLEKLTDGLPGPYRDRVFGIAEVLYQNGFVQDVSQDAPHQLPEPVVKKYASQIEFVDSLAGSGAARFQDYRHSNVLAVGSGLLLSSLVSSLFESGLARVNVLITDEAPTNRQRLRELSEHARKSDPEVELQEATLKDGWRGAVEPFDTVLYLTQEEDVEELRFLHAICREEKKRFIPAVYLKHVGVVGPVVHPESEVCWESAWRRLHSTQLLRDEPIPAASSTAGALLANVIVFELFKETTGITKPEQLNRVFLLDLETLEGSWHSFFPHPMETEHTSVEQVENIQRRLEDASERVEQGKLLPFLSVLTSKESGLFHLWEEGELKQLPLAQCRVQPVDPLSVGPAVLLEEIVCSGLTHEEARRESGLSGIEAYAARMAGALLPVQRDEIIGIGTGETLAECVGRGLQKCLNEQLRREQQIQGMTVSRVQLDEIEDERCRYYLEALTTMEGEPIIGLGEEMNGFQVVYVGTRDGWFGNADLNITLALRKSLQQALYQVQNHSESSTAIRLENSSVYLDEMDSFSMDIPAYDERIQSETLLEAIDILTRNQKQVVVYELGLEPVFKQELEGVFSVLLREEELH